MFLPIPFASKEMPNGKKLFRRKHGYTFALPVGASTCDIVVPYNEAKVNEIELLGFPTGVIADLTVHDTPTGTLSGVPNLQLNKFGFAVNIGPESWTDTSPYDADVIKDMIIRLSFTNSSAVSATIGINIVFHELIEP